MGKSRTQIVRAAGALLAAALFAGDAAAVDWSGLGADNNWSTGANWVGGVAPPSANTTLVNFPAAARILNVADAPWTINTMTFDISNYQITGQPITFAGAGAHIFSVGFQNSVANPIVLSGPMTVQPLLTLFLSGGISGTGPLSVPGGFVVLSGTSTFTGGTTLTGASLAVLGPSMPGPITVGMFSTLGALGTISGPVVVQATATFRPGSPPGSSTLGNVATGNLSIAGRMEIHIEGPSAATQYGNASVTGTVDLTGATLALSGAFVPPPGTVFTIIGNDAGDAVTGTFAGLPEGATVNFNGATLTVSYVGGSGNDVTLSAPAAAGAPTLTSVPTLSGWALIVLAALVLAAGMRSRRA